jgi:hypothetical protein
MVSCASAHAVSISKWLTSTNVFGHYWISISRLEFLPVVVEIFIYLFYYGKRTRGTCVKSLWRANTMPRVTERFLRLIRCWQYAWTNTNHQYLHAPSKQSYSTKRERRDRPSYCVENVTTNVYGVHEILTNIDQWADWASKGLRPQARSSGCRVGINGN